MQKHGITVIDDTYNASPVSMKAGLEVLEATAKGRRIAVLADMKELGPDSPKFHYEVGSWMKSIRWYFVYIRGTGGADCPGRKAGRNEGGVYPFRRKSVVMRWRKQSGQSCSRETVSF